MFNKLKLLIVGALAAALVFGTAPAALAAQEAPPGTQAVGTRWGGGEVTAVGTDSVTLHNPAGDHVINVDGATRFFDEQGQPASFADVLVGSRVRGLVERRADGTVYAKLAVIFPPPTEYAGVGVITQINADEQAFNFVNRRGKLWEFYVDAATVIANRAGESLAFDDLHAGQRAFVKAELRPDGKWWAIEMKIARPR